MGKINNLVEWLGRKPSADSPLNHAGQPAIIDCVAVRAEDQCNLLAKAEIIADGRSHTSVVRSAGPYTEKHLRSMINSADYMIRIGNRVMTHQNSWHHDLDQHIMAVAATHCDTLDDFGIKWDVSSGSNR